MNPPALHLLARQEMLDAAQFYEDQAAGLGDEFVAEVNRVADLAQNFRSAGHKYESGLRSLPLKRFPYILVYAPKSEPLFVLAIAHQRREPGYWIDRR